jgi:fumarate hydratase class II
MVEKGLMLGTALSPAIGYDRAAEIAKEAAATGSTIREMAREMAGLTDEQLDDLLDPVKMTEPSLSVGPGGG